MELSVSEQTVTTVVWFLEMTSADQLVAPSRPAPAELSIAEVARPSPAYVRFFYAAVGQDYAWNDRLTWTESQWRNELERDGVRLLTASVGGAPAGFALLVPGSDAETETETETEAEAEAGTDIEVGYFGLLPGWAGRGIGGALLYRAARTAWDAGATRLWLHTCSLDSPAALPSYRRRGFRVYREATRTQRLIDRAPW